MAAAKRALQAFVLLVCLAVFAIGALLQAPRAWRNYQQATIVAISLGIAIVLTFDAVGSLAARRYSFRYSKLAPASLVLDFLIGFMAAQLTDTDTAVLVGVMVGAVDATVGFLISWVIGPGRVEWERMGLRLSAGPALRMFVTMVVLAGGLALLGGILSAITQPTSWIYRR
jgi:hypothetical protein